MLVKQDPADADHLIVSTALTLAQAERKPVFVVGTDTDLLVMLISRSSSDTDIHMLCHRNLLQLYNIHELQLYVGDMKQHLMFVGLHAISGCDTLSTPYISVLPRLLLQGAAPCPLFVTPCPFEKAEMTPCPFD